MSIISFEKLESLNFDSINKLIKVSVSSITSHKLPILLCFNLLIRGCKSSIPKCELLIDFEWSIKILKTNVNYITAAKFKDPKRRGDKTFRCRIARPYAKK